MEAVLKSLDSVDMLEECTPISRRPLCSVGKRGGTLDVVGTEGFTDVR